jgi:nucleoside triphosphate pyrophosphatase
MRLKLKYPLLLGSQSPRRKELLQRMDLEFTVDSVDLDETLPPLIKPDRAAVYLAEEKAKALEKKYPGHIILTADTVVALDKEIFGKPANGSEARLMLEKLSGREHQVVTGICLTNEGIKSTAAESAYVTFNRLSERQINYYIEHYKPFDKAGGYGIQEWIGVTGISGIKGSYFNVMGLPVEKVYGLLQKMDLLEIL